MSERIKNVIWMLISLLHGLFLYILLRPQTFISKALANILPIGNLQLCFADWNCSFLRFYFPDLLWSFSLSCGLIAILNPAKTGRLLCCASAVFFGVLWEMGQHLDLLVGTGDIWDIVMYFSGACLSTLINLKEKQYEED